MKISKLALLLFFAPVLAAAEGVRALPSPLRDPVQARFASSLQPVELSLEGQTAKTFATLIGVVEQDPLRFSIDGYGTVRVATTAVFEDRDNTAAITARRGTATLEATEASSPATPARPDTLTIRGPAAHLLYDYLRLCRRLSITIDDDGSTIVGRDLVCHGVLNLTYSCNISALALATSIADSGDGD